MWRFRLGQGLTIAVSAGAFLIFAYWLAYMPAAAPFAPNTYPLFVELFVGALTRFPATAQAGIIFIAINGIAAAVISLFLALKGWNNEASRYLSSSLAGGALAVAYFYFLCVYPPFRALIGWQGNLVAAMAYDTVAFMLAGFSVFALLQFMVRFPTPISLADWERHLLSIIQRGHSTITKGWRRHVYPQKYLDAAQLSALGDTQEIASLYGYGHNAHQRAKLFGILLSNRPLQVFLSLAVMLGVFHYVVRLHLAGHPDPQQLPGWLLVLYLASSFVLLLQVSIFSLGFDILSFHRANGTEDERRRIDWIHSTLFVAGTGILALMLGGFALFVLLVMIGGESLAGYPLLLLLVGPVFVAVPLMVLALMVSLALSILYRGAIDPRLAARKITVWWLLGLVIAFLFVLVERAAALKITQWLSMAPETGPLIAGALVATTISPIRTRTEKIVNLLLARYLPVDAVIGGERKIASVAMSDLSGYTALSVQDEKRALLLAALLQQQAARVARAHQGRVVKSMGDAVMLEFESAAEACAALEDLHAGFPVAARTLGMQPLPLHSGAHHGEVTVGPDDDLYGRTVNLVARLQGVAGDDQIVLSNQIIAAARLSTDRIESLGPRMLKNIPEPVACFVLRKIADA